MPPFAIFLQMDTGPASPPPSMVAGPSSLWRLTERRSRKTGSGNIFSNVNLWQLERLFKAAGDQDAEQRAQLVWCHGDEAELAQALIGLRARSHRRALRSNGREALGSQWLRAFNHLRIGENTSNSQVKDPVEESDADTGAHGGQDQTLRPTSIGTTRRSPESQGPSGTTTERQARTGSGLRRGGGDSNPERYLHRILH